MLCLLHGGECSWGEREKGGWRKKKVLEDGTYLHKRVCASWGLGGYILGQESTPRHWGPLGNLWGTVEEETGARRGDVGTRQATFQRGEGSELLSWRHTQSEMLELFGEGVLCVHPEEKQRSLGTK